MMHMSFRMKYSRLELKVSQKVWPSPQEGQEVCGSAIEFTKLNVLDFKQMDQFQVQILIVYDLLRY